MAVRDRPPADPLHYQWAVIHDFLPRFVGDELVGPTGTVYKEVAGKPPVINLNYYKPTNRQGRPFMPVEFAVAAYRFGHSLIRPFYVLNSSGIVDVFGPEGAATQRWPPDPIRPGHRVEEHPSRRPDLPGPPAAQDRHQAVDSPQHPPRVGRPTS